MAPTAPLTSIRPKFNLFGRHLSGPASEAATKLRLPFPPLCPLWRKAGMEGAPIWNQRASHCHDETAARPLRGKIGQPHHFLGLASTLGSRANDALKFAAADATDSRRPDWPREVTIKSETRTEAMKATEALGKTDAGGLSLRILTSSLALFLISFGLLFAKSPDALLRPQLWAEDGAIFYAQQLGRSWPQLFVPYAGYMNFIPRLVAWLLAGVSPAYIPLSYNFSAIILSAACITYAVKTMSPLFGAGVALSAFFLTPDIGDIFGSITNIQWFAQFGLIFAVFASFREQRPSVIRHVAVVLFIFAAALSGPFSVFDAAVIALSWSAAAAGRRMNLGPPLSTRSGNWCRTSIRPGSSCSSFARSSKSQRCCRWESIPRRAPLSKGPKPCALSTPIACTSTRLTTPSAWPN